MGIIKNLSVNKKCHHNYNHHYKLLHHIKDHIINKVTKATLNKIVNHQEIMQIIIKI